MSEWVVGWGGYGKGNQSENILLEKKFSIKKINVDKNKRKIFFQDTGTSVLMGEVTAVRQVKLILLKF